MKRLLGPVILRLIIILIFLAIAFLAISFYLVRRKSNTESPPKEKQTPGVMERKDIVAPESVYIFPKNFMWGVATSAFQNEGGDGKTDWDNWPPYKTSEADHPGFTKEDVKLAKQLGVTHIRFSIEWAKVEPREGAWDEKAVADYFKLAGTMRKNGIEPFVNLNHFTLPQWVAERGGWENDSAVIWFGRYAEKIAQNFKPLKITWWMTFNEPGVIISRGYLDGKYPPGKKISPAAAYRVVRNLYRAHALAYRKLHEILDYPQRKVLVGIAHYTTRYASYLSFLPDPTVFEIDSISGSLDYIGLNYYGLTGVRFFGNTIVEFKTEVSPEGIYDLVRDFQSYGKPIIISENGIDDSADVLRPKFIVEHLFWLHRAIQDSVVKGVPIIGYFYWTFIDNYEWDRLAISRMGLVEFDIKTRARKPRPSAYLFRDIARVNGVTPKILEKHRVHEKNRD